jgi:Mrp family chromosome partitioning ATPase
MSHAGADEQRLARTLGSIGRSLVVLSGKGGVGKSTVAAAIAAGCAQQGSRVGLLDSDLHGPSIPKMLGLEHYRAAGQSDSLRPATLCEGRLKVMSVQFLLQSLNDAVIWRGPLKHAIISQFIGYTQWDALDMLIIDSPPGTGDEPLSVVQSAKPHGAIVVTTPQEIATFDVRKSIDFCEKLNLPIAGVVENMSGFVCPRCAERCDIFGSGGGRRLADDYGLPFLGAVPIDPLLVSRADSGKAIMDSAADSATAAALGAIVARIMNPAQAPSSR